MKMQSTPDRKKVWRRLKDNLEIWDLVKLEEQNSLDATQLAFVSETLAPDKSSYFTYQVGRKTGWECRRKEAFKRVEDLLSGK